MCLRMLMLGNTFMELIHNSSTLRCMLQFVLLWSEKIMECPSLWICICVFVNCWHLKLHVHARNPELNGNACTWITQNLQWHFVQLQETQSHKGGACGWHRSIILLPHVHLRLRLVKQCSRGGIYYSNTETLGHMSKSRQVFSEEMRRIKVSVTDPNALMLQQSMWKSAG